MLFCCDVCGCTDLTDFAYTNAVELPEGRFECSACRARVGASGELLPGEWHGNFVQSAYNPEFDIVCNRPTGIGLS